MMPQVLFVSKPVVPPFNDGSKCLVRDIASALRSYAPRVMVTRETGTWAPEILEAKVYAGVGGYSPALMENARVLAWLLTRSSDALWHFLFAPNPRTSQTGKWLKRIRRVPVVQTIASPPRSFLEPQRLLFGDVVAAQSHWTKNEFLRAYADAGIPDVPQIEVIAPAVPDFARPSTDRVMAIRDRLQVPADAPLFLYPGDLEVASARESVESMIKPLLSEASNAHLVFAYRRKTERAQEIAVQMQARLPSQSVHFMSDVPDMHALIATSQLLLFPVVDLYGKVDLPIVVLEAMHLGVPVVTVDQGPLADLAGVWRVSPGDPRALLRTALLALWDEPARMACIAAQREAIERQHRPVQVAGRYEKLYDRLLGRA